MASTRAWPLVSTGKSLSFRPFSEITASVQLAAGPYNSLLGEQKRRQRGCEAFGVVGLLATVSKEPQIPEVQAL